jgi:adenosine deaminase
MNISTLPKAELHVHLEGTILPSMVVKLAQRNNLPVPEGIFGPNETFVYRDFLHFLQVFDQACSVIHTAQDYQDITYDYLARTAKEGAIYVEFMPSPDHAALCGISYTEMLEHSIKAIDRARQDYGIESRIIIVCVRHFGVKKCLHVVEEAIQNPHPYVVGIGMGGNEVDFPPGLFKQVFAKADNAGLGCTVHAGEWAGPEKIWEAINQLPVTRLGHGVRSSEDPKLMAELATRKIILETSPGSNIALGVYPDFAQHPWLKLKAAGIPLTLNSDDPPYYATSVGQEYANAGEHFKLSEGELIAITRTAIEGAFVDREIKKKLMDKLI